MSVYIVICLVILRPVNFYSTGGNINLKRHLLALFFYNLMIKCHIYVVIWCNSLNI